MNTEIVSVDRNALPNALLPAFKRWARVDFCDDDILLCEILQGAIEQFERNTEITVFKSPMVIEPEASDYLCGSTSAVRLPVTPIHSVQVFVGAVPHSDLTFLSDGTGYVSLAPDGTYAIKAKGIHGVRIYSLIGPQADGLSVNIESGWDVETLPPEIRQTVFQIAAHLFEYREIAWPTNIVEPPFWMSQIISGFWLPRV